MRKIIFLLFLMALSAFADEKPRYNEKEMYQAWVNNKWTDYFFESFKEAERVGSEDTWRDAGYTIVQEDKNCYVFDGDINMTEKEYFTCQQVEVTNFRCLIQDDYSKDSDGHYKKFQMTVENKTGRFCRNHCVIEYEREFKTGEELQKIPDSKFYQVCNADFTIKEEFKNGSLAGGDPLRRCAPDRKWYETNVEAYIGGVHYAPNSYYYQRSTGKFCGFEPYEPKEKPEKQPKDDKEPKKDVKEEKKDKEQDNKKEQEKSETKETETEKQPSKRKGGSSAGSAASEDSSDTKGASGKESEAKGGKGSSSDSAASEGSSDTKGASGKESEAKGGKGSSSDSAASEGSSDTKGASGKESEAKGGKGSSSDSVASEGSSDTKGASGKESEAKGGGNSEISGGYCGDNAPSCKGDAVQCYIAKKQFQQACEAEEQAKQRRTLENFAKNHGNSAELANANPFEVLKRNEHVIDFSGKTFNTQGFGWSRSCPMTKTINFGIFGTHEIQSDLFCELARILGHLCVLITAIICAKAIMLKEE